MQYLSDYSLQCAINTNFKKYKLSATLVGLLRLLTVICLVCIFFNYYFAIPFVILYITSFVTSYYRKTLVFHYKYTVSGGKLSVIKQNLQQKEQILSEMLLIDIVECSVGEQDIDNNFKFYDKEFKNGFVITIATKTQKIAIVGDEYMYSILSFALNKGENA